MKGIGLVLGAAALAFAGFAAASKGGQSAEEIVVVQTADSIAGLARGGNITGFSAALAAFTGATAGDAKLYEGLAKSDPSATKQLQALVRQRVRGMTQTELLLQATAADARQNVSLGNAWRELARQKA